MPMKSCRRQLNRKTVWNYLRRPGPRIVKTKNLTKCWKTLRILPDFQLFSLKKVAGSLVKLSEFIFQVFILYFQSYLFSFCTISSGLRVQFRYLLANLRKVYVHDRVETTKREMFSQKGIRWFVQWFVNIRQCFVSIRQWFVMGAMLLASALNKGISPGMTDPFSIFPGGDFLCLGHWLRTWRPCAVLHAQWRTPYAFSYLQYCAKVVGIPLFASHVKANI